MIKTFEQQRFHRFIIELVNIWALWKICETKNSDRQYKRKKKLMLTMSAQMLCITDITNYSGGRNILEEKRKTRKIRRRKNKLSKKKNGRKIEKNVLLTFNAGCGVVEFLDHIS